MGEQSTSVKHTLRKFLFSKNSVTIRSNCKIVSCGIDDDKTPTHGEIENRGIELKNYKSSMECSTTDFIRNSFLPSNHVSPTHSQFIADGKVMVDGNLTGDVNVNTRCTTIPIIIITDLSEKYVKSRRIV